MPGLRWDRAAALAGPGTLLALAPAAGGFIAFTVGAITLAVSCAALVLPPARPALVPALILLFVGAALLWSYGAYLIIAFVLFLQGVMPAALAGILASAPFVGLFALLQAVLRPASRAGT